MSVTVLFVGGWACSDEHRADVLQELKTGTHTKLVLNCSQSLSVASLGTMALSTTNSGVGLVGSPGKKVNPSEK